MRNLGSVVRVKLCEKESKVSYESSTLGLTRFQTHGSLREVMFL